MNNTSLPLNTSGSIPVVSADLPGVEYIPMVDKATSDLVQDIIYCGFLPVMALLGTMGNVLSCVVLLIQGLKDTTNIFLFTLTLSDSIYLLITGVRRVECIISKFNPLMGHNLYMVTLPQLKPIAIICGRFTGLITMLISVERCIAVTKPMKVKIWFVPKTVWIMIAVLFTINLGLLFPMFFTMELKWMTDPRSGSPMSYVKLTSFYLDNLQSLNWYLNIFLSVILRFFPMVFIFTASITIIITVKRSASFQKTSSSAKNDKIAKITKMMLTICISYVIFNIPATVHQLLAFFYEEYNLRGKEQNIFYLVSAFGQLTELISSSWNFIIYIALSEKFSSVLKDLLCKCCRNISFGQTTVSSSAGTKETRLTSKTGKFSSTDDTKSGTVEDAKSSTYEDAKSDLTDQNNLPVPKV